MSRVAVRYIQTPSQWSALTTPIRFEIIEAMRDLAPCGIKAVASRLGVKPDSLYRHFEILIDSEFIIPAGFRKVTRATEQLFDLTAGDFNINFDSTADPGPANDMLRDTAIMFLKQQAAVIKRTAAARAFDTTQSGKNTTVLNDFAHLTRTEFLQLATMTRKIKEFLDSTRGRPTTPSTKLYSVLLAATPVTPRTRKKKRFKNSPAKPLKIKEKV